MPKIINEIGNQYNNLIVIRQGETKNKRKHWICQCQHCGKEYEFSGTVLRSGATSVKCPDCEKIGQKFGRLTVLSYATTASDRHKYWLCQCDCGNQEIVRATDLNTGRKIECLQCQKLKQSRQYVNEIGNKYGKLTILALDETKNNKNAYWICQCECGTITSVAGTKLRNGHTLSCGCLTSVGEEKISRLLTTATINFKKEISFTDLKDKALLRFDFGIYDDNDKLLYLIEYDGEQHFKATNGIFNEEAVLKIQHRDAIKNTYCFQHNIPLIRIPYFHYPNLTLNDLILEDSIFVVKD